MTVQESFDNFILSRKLADLSLKEAVKNSVSMGKNLF